MHRSRLAVIAIMLLGLPISAVAEPVDFNRDVRPILADRCFTCHGPDAQQRQGELRLDLPEAALAPRKGRAAIVPGKSDESEAWRRIIATDADERMPPKEGGRALSAEQIATLKRWIDEGAKWQTHWAFTPPQTPTLPEVKDRDRLRSPLDSFVTARLEKEELVPSPEADQSALLRRLALDLIGLPPTPAELKDFLNDAAPDAYERAVDRLLASPRYGERMAVRWLDAARYADTSGYQTDGERHMWRWRDWVIEAFNANMPFDQFTIEQLAGDLLPNPTLEQRIATGFNRNHRGNAEGGIIPEEYAVEYVVDRVETTSTVWLGLTMGCVRCHDHKFDPFTQRDFYGLYAFFNNVPEKGRAVKLGNSPPLIKSPTRAQAARLAALSQELERQRHAWREQGLPRVEAEQTAWEKTRMPPPRDWLPEENLVLAVPLEGEAEAPRTEASAEQNPLNFGPGRIGRAAIFEGTQIYAAGNVADFGFTDKFTLSAWVRIDAEGGGTILSRMTDVLEGDGYQLAIGKGKLQLNLVKRWLDDSLRLESAEAVPPGDWHHVAAVYDGSRVATGIKLYLDGKELKNVVRLDELNQTFNTKQPLRIGGGGGPAARFRGAIDEVRIYRADLSAEQMRMLATAETLAEILGVPVARRISGQHGKLREYFLAHHAAADLQAQSRQLRRLEQEWRVFHENLPTTMVMEELPESRPTHLLLRGQYDKPGEKVAAGVPPKLGSWPAAAARNRLGLARWLLDPAHPLTARVSVNRFWQAYFGVGLVKTTEDFGAQGDQPAYPELLDSLAVEFLAHWDVKRLQREIVSSATYRQTSRAARELLQRDPENRLLARGPRVRLSAEMVRDQALFAGGLLVEEIGGPSVKPRQPAGLWKELTGGDDYVPGQGADLVRRSLYTYWKRTIPPPAMATFDAASREFCTVRESRTNTPLQALVLLNDQDYADAALGTAARVVCEATSEQERLDFAYRLVLSRDPKPSEREVIARSLARHRAYYQSQPADAEKLLAASPLVKATDLPAIDLATWAAVTSTLLNLDETVTKE